MSRPTARAAGIAGGDASLVRLLRRAVSTDLQHHGSSYRPPMDGYRGLFVVLVMAYHFGATFLVGGWVGINHFFVFSGFLIGTILIKEVQREGRIDAIRFYLRRARRIIPAMALLVVAVLVHLAFSTSENRPQTAGDAGATMTFWLNWRLIARNDQYFDMFDTPSPLRHVWTLSVEEQFYVVIPLLIYLVYRFLRTRTARFAVVLGLALASAALTWHLSNGATSSRLYYGTDVRMQALLVGVAGAVFWTRARDGSRIELSRTAANAIGWVGSIISIGAFFVLSETSIGMFRYGGMTWFAVIAAFMGITALDTRDLSINRVFSHPVLVHLGQISYGLYLFHWPVGLWFTFDELPRVVAGALQFLITWVLAVASYRLVELPIMLHGVSGLVRVQGVRSVVGPGFVAAVSVVSFSLAGALPGPNDTPYNGVPLVPSARYARPAHEVRVAMVGDSVPASLQDGFTDATYPGLALLRHAEQGGCLPEPVTRVILGHDTPEQPNCPTWREGWPPAARGERADVVLAPVGIAYTFPLRVDGEVVQGHDPRVRATVRGGLDALLAQTRAAGARQLQVIAEPCRVLFPSRLPGQGAKVFGEKPVVLDTAYLNGIARQWASEQHGDVDVTVLALDRALCPSGFREYVNGNQVYKEGVHFTGAGARMVWTWLAPEVVRAWDARGR